MDFRRARYAHADRPEPLRHLVEAYRPDAAKVAFQRAIDLDPKYSSARYGLGTLLRTLPDATR